MARRLTTSEGQAIWSRLERRLTSLDEALEFYLYSALDTWAIYFHHEGFAFCGGVPSFVGELRERCRELILEPFPEALREAWGVGRPAE